MKDDAIAVWLDETRAIRHDLPEALARDLAGHGQMLEVEGHLIGDGRVTGKSPRGNGDDRLVTVGRLARAAGALIRAVLDLSVTGNWVGIGALTRQLVELEYLLWTFEHEDEAAAGWLNSTGKERLKSWQPVHLRLRSDGHFRQEQYSTHCEVGGHPTPDGLRLLLDPPRIVRALLALEAIDHGIPIWRSVQGFRRLADSEHTERLIDQWHSAGPPPWQGNNPVHPAIASQ